NIRLATDSDRLAEELSHLTSLPVEVLPIPHAAPTPAGLTDQVTAGPCHFVSLGNARDEKGIFEIFAAIRALHDDGKLESMRFTLQCNDATPTVASAIAAFRQDSLPECQLLTNRLTTAEYHDLLEQADFVLLPYWRSIYASRTSGVFMEALSAA